MTDSAATAKAVPRAPTRAAGKAALRVSRWLHKYVGLVLVLFLMWMSLSGVLLNHPDLISGLSVPRALVPSQYHPINWNRSGIVSAVFPRSEPGVAYLAGKLGIYRSVDGQVQDRPVHEGLPDSDYYRKTRQLFLLGSSKDEYLLAATGAGLFQRSLPDGSWQPIALGPEREAALKILRVRDTLLVFTDSAAYVSRLDGGSLDFTRRDLLRPSAEARVSWVRLVFDLHDGKVWGLPGRLLFDLVGITLFYLSVSAFYAWYYPKRVVAWRCRRRKRPPRWMGRLFRFIHRYHLKLGVWSAAVLLVIGVTGFFMRPPMLMLLGGDVSAGWYPGPLDPNPWQRKINNALYDPDRDRLLIQADDGVWQGNADPDVPFTKVRLPAPIFIMGATVFDSEPDQTYLVGSFSGIFRVEPERRRTVSLLTPQQAPPRSRMRPADKMVTGHFSTPDGGMYVTTHHLGLLDARGDMATVFAMPPAVRNHYRMPLWNYLFEIHNGRFFRDWLKDGYILLVPLGSLLFILITLSGVYDWAYHKIRRSHRPDRPGQTRQ